MEKYDIVNGLAREFGLRRYLEICTPTTGKKFQYVDAEHFDVCHRLIYRCHADHDDGFETTRRTADDSSGENLNVLSQRCLAGERDVIMYHAAFAQSDIRTDDRVRTHADVGTQLSFGINDGGRVNHSRF